MFLLVRDIISTYQNINVVTMTEFVEKCRYLPWVNLLGNKVFISDDYGENVTSNADFKLQKEMTYKGTAGAIINPDLGVSSHNLSYVAQRAGRNLSQNT